MSDASFKDGQETSLKLIARDSDDLGIISAMIQDAIAERIEMIFEADRKCFSLLLKRFRWEDADDAKRQNRPFERVQSVLMIQSANGAKFRGFESADKDLAFDLIGIQESGTEIVLAFAGDGEIAISCECVDVLLTDVSRPYKAKSQTLPRHKEL